MKKMKRFFLECWKLLTEQPMIVKTEMGEDMYDQNAYMSSYTSANKS